MTYIPTYKKGSFAKEQVGWAGPEDHKVKSLNKAMADARADQKDASKHLGGSFSSGGLNVYTTKRPPSPKPIPAGAHGTERVKQPHWGMKQRTDEQMKASSKSDPARTYKGAGKSVSGVVKSPKTDWSSPKHTKPKPKPKAGMNGGVMIPKKKDSALKWLNTPFGRF